MYRWSNAENFGSVRLMVRKKISSQTDSRTDRQTRRIHKRLFSDEKSANHRSSVTRTRDKKGHVLGHVTLTHSVTLEGYSMDLGSFEFYKQNYMQNSSKIISVAYPGLQIETNM